MTISEMRTLLNRLPVEYDDRSVGVVHGDCLDDLDLILCAYELQIIPVKFPTYARPCIYSEGRPQNKIVVSL